MSSEVSSIAVAEIDGRGRSVVASKALKGGQVVLRESPIVIYSALPLTHVSSYCNHCFRSLSQSSSSSSSSTSTSTCASCLLVFCSPACVSLASTTSHSPYACQALSRLHQYHSLNQPHERLVQARFLIAAYNLSLVSPSDFPTLLSLQGTPLDIDVSIAQFLQPLIPSISIDLAASLLAKDRINAFGLMEPFNPQKIERHVRAYAIYPKASFFNHDCLPNACRFDYLDNNTSNTNTDMIVRILHDVPQGREICLSYFPVNLDYPTRQKRLLEDYGFVCDCDRCKVESSWSLSEMDEEEEEEEDEQMLDGAPSEEDKDDDFPHAYFFMTYMCDTNNCGGTLAPLPPSPSTSTSNVMECNVCGNLKSGCTFGEEDD